MTADLAFEAWGETAGELLAAAGAGSGEGDGGGGDLAGGGGFPADGEYLRGEEVGTAGFGSF